MNIVNPCKSLLLVGSFCLSFGGVRADGTLPLPLTNDHQSFQADGRAFEVGDMSTSPGAGDLVVDVTLKLTAARPNTTVSAKLKERCKANEQAYPVAGTVIVNEELFSVQAICAASPSAGPRQVLAVSSARILQFDGRVVQDPNTLKVTSFSGELKRVDSVVTSPEDGGQGEKRVLFELNAR